MIKRLKFDLEDLVNEMLDKLPEEVFKSSSTTFLDPEIGGGQFVTVIEERLRKYGHSDINISKRVFGLTGNKIRLNYIKNTYKLNGTYSTGDFLTGKHNDMKFDIVVGNPPYQDSNGAASSKAIWHEFVYKALDVLVEGGHLCIIHPNGWRAPSGKFFKVQETLLKNNLKFLKLADFEEGRRIFNVGTSFDYYILSKEPYLNSTTVIDSEQNESTFNLKELTVIATHSQNKLNKLIAGEGEDKVDYLYHTKYHTQRDYISKEQLGDFIHPVVYTITKSNGIKLTYSSRTDLGHFGKPKVIWTNGMGTYPILDLEGKYGMNEFSFAIGGDENYLLKVKAAMETPEFLELMSAVRFTNNKYVGKVIKTFKKDFWKDFV